MKRPKDLEQMRKTVAASRKRSLEQFSRRHAARIINFDFKPGALVLVRNSRIEDSLNHKTKPLLRWVQW